MLARGEQANTEMLHNVISIESYIIHDSWQWCYMRNSTCCCSSQLAHDTVHGRDPEVAEEYLDVVQHAAMLEISATGPRCIT